MSGGRLGLAVIGLGLALPPHAAALADLADRVRVVAAYGRSPAGRAAAAERCGWPVADDLDALAADPAVEAALILTPPASHLPIAERFLRAGKHVLVEKPLEVDLPRAEALVALAADADRRLGVVLQHRFRRGSVALRDMLAAGDLGRIAAATCTVPWWRDQAYYDVPGRGTLERDGGGVLMTQAIHTIDLLLSLLGPVEAVAAVAATTPLHRMQCEDFAAATLRFASGAVGSLVATTAAYPGEPEELCLIGETGVARLRAGSLRLERPGREPVTVEEDGRSGAGASPMDFDHAAHRALIADFVDAVADRRPPLADGRAALATQRLLASIIEAAETRRWLAPGG